jgi:hypothetical protein
MLLMMLSLEFEMVSEDSACVDQKAPIAVLDRSGVLWKQRGELPNLRH